MANKSTRLTDADVRALLRLNNELHELPRDLPILRQHLLEGICRIAGARAGISSGFAYGPDGQRRRTDATVHGFDAAGLRHASRYFATGDPPDPFESALKSADGTSRTFLRDQLVPDRQWYRSAHYNEVRKPAGVDHCVASNFDSPGDGWRDELCIHRDGGDASFSVRQQKMLHLFHLESDWICRPVPAPADPSIAALAPRVKRVLDLLLAGDGEKQVAIKLGLSRHTVHQYVKMLYRELEVSSRAELMARCLTRATPNDPH